MKSIIKLIIAIVMLSLLVSTPALAISASEGTAYRIDELGMSVNMPSDLYVFTRNIDPDDPRPSYFRLNREAFINYFNDHNIYLNAISEKVLYEINIMMVTNTNQNVRNFTEYTDAELQAFLKSSASTYEMENVNYVKSDIYTGNPQFRFVRSSFIKTNGTNLAYGIQYFTVFDGKEINVVLDSYDKAITPDREAIISKVIDNITLTRTSAPNENVGAASDTGNMGLGDNSGIASTMNAANAVYNEGNAGLLGTNLSKLSGVSLIFLILIDIAATFVLLTLPILIYRYLIIKEPLLKHRAKKIAIIYGVSAGIIIGAYMVFTSNVFMAIGIFLWSFINYLVLSKGRAKGYLPFMPVKPVKPVKLAKPAKSSDVKLKVKEHDETDANPSPSLSVSKTCKNCFAVNLADSNTCFYCGAQMDRDEEEDEDLN